MICSKCNKVINPKDSPIVYRQGGVDWAHLVCGGKTEPRAPRDILEDLVTLIKRMVQVEPIGDQTREEWAESRARNCVQALIADYNITRKE